MVDQTAQAEQPSPVYTPEAYPKDFKDALEIDGIFEIGRATAEIDGYGIYTNQGFRRVAPRKIIEAKADGEPLGMIIGDLDSLKAVNDELGHAAGDTVINAAKAVIRDLIEELDIEIEAGRTGGDEFSMLCHGDEETVRYIASEFRKRYKKYVADPGNGEFQERGLSLSVGFSTLSEEADDFSSLMRAADVDMYEDKESKLGKLTKEQELGLLAAKNELDTSEIRLRDAPKLWRQRGLL